MRTVIVGGKTGTAQVVRMEKFKSLPESLLPRKYKDHAWFTCFAPADKPEIAVTVLVEHSGHGGSVAAPIARKVLEEYFKEKTDAQVDKVKDILRSEGQATQSDSAD
jgi:penicillin-binding protein 2